EQVINNILEDKLVPYLDKLDRAMQRCGAASGTALMPFVFLFAEKVTCRDLHTAFLCLPTCLRAVEGRREKDTTRSLLNDKRVVAEQRERYSQYSVVVEEIPVQPGDPQLYGEDYEDEYDDTYDGNQVGANDADSDDELISRR
ncbi:ASCC2 protein, partial [Aegotheles bennettii]|nr:ASCC2 protein [Aegotheles bennettii]